MAKKSAAKPAAAEELKAKKDIQKAVKLETKKKVRPRLLCAHSRRICRNRVAEYCHATPSLFRSSLPPTMIPMTPMRSPRRSRPLRRRSVRAPPICRHPIYAERLDRGLRLHTMSLSICALLTTRMLLLCSVGCGQGSASGQGGSRKGGCQGKPIRYLQSIGADACIPRCLHSPSSKQSVTQNPP